MITRSPPKSTSLRSRMSASTLPLCGNTERVQALTSADERTRRQDTAQPGPAKTQVGSREDSAFRIEILVPDGAKRPGIPQAATVGPDGMAAVDLSHANTYQVKVYNHSASEVAFTARLDSALPIRMDREEHDEYGWFTFAEAYERIKWSDDHEALEQLERSLT